MITQPENNITLTDAHKASIEEGQKRLLNLQALEDVSNRNLKTLKLETERITKDIVLGQTKLDALNDLIKVSQDAVDKLSEQRYELTTDIELAKTELSEVRGASDRKMAEVTEQVKLHKDKEADLVSRETSVAFREKEVAKYTAELQDKHNKIISFA